MKFKILTASLITALVLVPTIVRAEYKKIGESLNGHEIYVDSKEILSKRNLIIFYQLIKKDNGSTVGFKVHADCNNRNYRYLSVDDGIAYSSDEVGLDAKFQKAPKDTMQAIAIKYACNLR